MSLIEWQRCGLDQQGDNMSKLSEYLGKPINKRTTDILVEEKIQTSDKDKIKSIIKKPKKTKFKIKSYKDEDNIFELSDAGKYWMMEFNADFFELSEFVVDVFDKDKIKIKSGFDKVDNKQWFMFDKKEE